MPLIHENKQPLSTRDALAITDLLKGSLNSIVKKLEATKKTFKKKQDPGSVFDPIIKIYKDEIDALQNKINTAQNNREQLSATEFIQKTYEDLAEKSVATLDPGHPLHAAVVNTLFKDLGGTVYPKRLVPDIGMEQQDKPEVYKEQVDTFELAKEPMEGVEDIIEYDPSSDRVITLYEARSGNSTTLKAGRLKELEDLAEKQKAEFDQKGYKEAVKELEAARKAPFGLHAAAEYSRIRSSEMKNKDHIEFSDVYETYTNINKMARPGDPKGGVLRGGSISAGDLIGPGATAVPQQVYQTLNTIADNMNKIKQTKDPALQKSQAIQLAAFAYQTTLSEHAFEDGNGRTCRMFADSILQTFGLPPHTPDKNTSEIIKTFDEGGSMDYNKGAEVFLANIKKTNEALKMDPEAAKQRLYSEMPEKKPGGINEQYSLKFSAIYEVSDDTVETLRTLKESARRAKGRYRDSKEYKDFCKSIDKSYELASSIQKNRNMEGFDMKKADAEYASSVRKLFKTASDYKTYKMKDHTENQLEEPNKKRLNQKDRDKLGLVNNLMENKDLIKVKKVPERPDGPILQ